MFYQLVHLGTKIIAADFIVPATTQSDPQLGKVLAKNVFAQLDKLEDGTGHDRSTTGLIHYYQKHRKE